MLNKIIRSHIINKQWVFIFGSNIKMIDPAYSCVSTLFSVDKFTVGVAFQTVIKINSSCITIMLTQMKY